MVLPLLVGLIGFGVIGGFTLFALQEVVFWGSIAAGGLFGFKTLRFLLSDRPLELVDDELGNNMIYLIVSAVVSLVAFKAVQSAFIAFGGLAAIIVGVLLVVGYFVGFGTLIGGIVALLGEVNETVDQF